MTPSRVSSSRFAWPAAAALATAVLWPGADARAQRVPLWCDGLEPYAAQGGLCPNNGCVDGEIPIGTDVAQGHHWKETILDWLRSLDPMEFDLGATPTLTPIETAWFGLAPWWNPNDPNACENEPQWPALLAATNLPGSNARMEAESLLLHRSGEEWGALVNLHTPPSQFEMSRLEDRTQCETRVPEYQLDPDLTSLAAMEYVGNPYFTDPDLNRAMLMRGLLNAGVYLVLTDYVWWPHGGAGPTYAVGGGFPRMPAGPTPQASDVSPYTGNVLPRAGLKYDEFHGQTVLAGNTQMNDFDISGWGMSNFAYVYIIARAGLGADLPPDVQEAFEEAFLTFAEYIAPQRQLTQFANLASRSVVALWFAMEAQSDPSDRAYLRQVYDTASESFYDPILTNVQPWGTLHDVSGFDTGYNNLNLLHMSKLLIADPTGGGPMLRAAAERAFDLWAHLVFPETLTNGSLRHVSPTAFNSRTGEGAAASGMFGDATVVQRFLAAGVANLPWAWAVLAHAEYPWGSAAPVDPWVQMVCDWIYEKFDYWFLPAFLNFGGGGVPASMLSTTPPLFDLTVSSFFQPGSGTNSTLLQNRAHTHPNALFLYGEVFGEKANWFPRWDAAAQIPAATEMPWEVRPPYYWSAPSSFAPGSSGAFFYAHPSDQVGDDLVTLVHAGPVGTLGQFGLPDGYGGGQLATLWTPTSGPFVLARRRGRNGGFADNDQWPEWRALPVHAVSMARGGGITSSSRIVTPTVSSQDLTTQAPSDTTALGWLAAHPGCGAPQLPWSLTPPVGVSGLNGQLVSIRGNIPTEINGTNAITAPLPYRREILTGVGYVAVQTSVCPQVKTPLDEAYETLPLHYGEYNSAYHQLPSPGDHGDYTVRFESMTNGQLSSFLWDPSMAQPPMMNNVVRVVVTRFGGRLEIAFDQLRRVGLSATYNAYQGFSWNLLIDLLPAPGALLPTSSVRYVMRTI